MYCEAVSLRQPPLSLLNLHQYQSLPLLELGKAAHIKFLIMKLDLHSSVSLSVQPMATLPQYLQTRKAATDVQIF